MPSLTFLERPPSGPAQGLLLLHHGRGTDERDLLPLGDALDPQRRLHVVTPRGPLQPPGAVGYYWYLPRRVGYPEPESFRISYAELADFHDELWQRTGIAPERTVIGGFSMGTAMSYALGLGRERPAPAGILAFSGFFPTVEGWEPDLEGRPGLPVLIAHGRLDPVIGVEFGRQARDLLERAGLKVEYSESEAEHTIDPADIPRAISWLAKTLDGTGS